MLLGMSINSISMLKKKPSVKRIPQDKGATGNMQTEEARKGLSDNPTAWCSGGVDHFLGNSVSPLTGPSTLLMSCSLPY